MYRMSGHKQGTPASSSWQGVRRKTRISKRSNRTRSASAILAKKARGQITVSHRNGALSNRVRLLRSSRLERLKIREQWLREEIRANREITLGIMKWGVAVLTAADGLLYYVRRDVANRMFEM